MMTCRRTCTCRRRRTCRWLMVLSAAVLLLVAMMALETASSSLVVTAFLVAAPSRRPVPRSVSSSLSVGTDPATLVPLIPAEDDDNDDKDEQKVMNGLVSGFLDLEDTTTSSVSLEPPLLEEDETASASQREGSEETANDADDDLFVRDEADRLEELEDRYYVDESGLKRKVERCILVGVQDVSALRRKRRQEQLAARRAAESSSYSFPQQQQPQQHLSGHNQNNDDEPLFTLEESMVEMRELLKTAGLQLCGEITQRLNEVNPKTYVGSGKVQQAKALLEQQDACTIVFDAELTPGQQKALENAFNRNLLQNDFMVSEGEIKVIDRTALILDIFAMHAKTREGKLQVDLALHEYRKPRLTRMWTHLERQSGAGGVGLRGPGESQLEIDKRLLRDRIITLKQKIANVQKQRSMHRKGRERTGLPVLALVGYTNAGKSSFLNYLTRAGVLAESMLFATLDPTTRRVKLPGFRTSPEVLLTDTVGFIQKLPTNLVAAFRATLEEVKEADVLVHVIDVSNPTWEKQERAVLSVLDDLNVADKPVVRVLNKIDLLDPEEAEYMQYEAALASDYTVAVSALQGTGMQDFVAVAEQAMAELLVPIEIELPYSMGDELNSIHEQGNVELVDYSETGTYVRALVPRSIAMRLQDYRVDNDDPTTTTTDSSSASAAASPVNGNDDDNDNDDDDIDWVALGRGRHSANSEL